MFPPVFSLLQAALAHHNAGRLGDAEPLYREALKAEPGNVDAMHLLGVLLGQTGRAAAAVPLLQAAVRQVPASAAYRLHLAGVLEDVGLHREAVEAFSVAARLDPSNAEAHGGLGRVLLALGRVDPGIAALKQAAELQPQEPTALGNYGAALTFGGRASEAVPVLQHAVRIAPQQGINWLRLADALYRLRKYDESLSTARRAQDLLPAEIQPLLLVGNILLTLSRSQEAAATYQQLLRLEPRNVSARTNLALSLVQLAQPGRAVEICNEVLAECPGDAGTLANRSLARLTLGDFKGGWSDYEARWNTPDLANSIQSNRPRWDGSPLAGRTILLTAEQGLGDSIQFIRYAPLVAARGGRVIVACQPELRNILSTIAGVVGMITLGEPPPAFDVYAPLISLPRLLDTTLQTIPSQVPYLRAEPARVELWRRRLAREGRLKVGLVWAGNPDYQNDRARSSSLATFAPLAWVPGVALYAVQKGERADEAANPPAGMDIMPLGNELSDFAETAALLECLDLLISTDTSVVHMAGALARPVWTLLALGADWRWMLDRDDSPWYPTMRLFRQPAIGDWRAVLNRVAAELSAIARNRPGL